MISSSSPELTRSPRRTARLPATAVVFLGALAAGGAVRFWQLRGRDPMEWNDTADFLASSREPWLSTELWIGKRSPLTPVVLKVLGGDLGHYVTFQAVVAAACWAALAASVGSVVAPGWRRVAAVVAVVAFSLTDLVVMWDQSALSESPAVSLLALAVAAGAQVAARPSRVTVAGLVAVLAVWLGLRDSPAVVAVAGGLALGAALAAHRLWARRRHQERPGPALATPLTALAAGALLVGLAALAASSHGQRHVFPLRNVLQVRVLPYADRVEWFADHGMPQADAFAGPESLRPYREEGRAPVTYVPDSARDGDLGEWFAWLEGDARATFARWVLTHPGYLLTEPYEAPERTFNNAGGDRQFYAFPDRRKVPLVDGVLAPRSWIVVLVGAAVAGWAFGRNRVTPALVAGAVTAALALPHGAVAWHSDGMETARHLVIPALQLHLGVLLMLVGMLRPAARPQPVADPDDGAGAKAGDDAGVGSAHG
jgi:hypothetical protein